MAAYLGTNSVKKLAKSAGVFLIPGEEIKVLGGVGEKKVVGEVVAYFLQKQIRPSTFDNILDSVHSQGALLSCPHPFDWPRKNFKSFPKVWKEFDCMEIYNARAYYNGLNKKAKSFSDRIEVAGNIALLGVSDAHTPQEIGNGLTEINATNEEEFRKEIKQCRTKVIPMARAWFWDHFQTQLAKRNWVKER